MENLTNQVIVLGDDEKFYIMRQALYKGTTYFLAAKVTADEKDFTDEFAFLEAKVEDGQEYVREVTDQEVLKVLFQNISLDDIDDEEEGEEA